MAHYVLVHGGNMSTDTWNRLAGREVYPPGGHLGGEVWDPIVASLAAENNSVFAPTLKDEHTCDLTGHIGQICGLVAEHDLKGVILVGHSYGGMVITGAAAEMPEKIRHMVYVDAALPDPGQSLFDLFTCSGCDPLSFAGLEAAAAYVEKLRFDPRAIAPIPKTYILCTESEFACVTRLAKLKIAGARSGWDYLEWPTCHVPMATMPEDMTRLLLEIGARDLGG